MKKLTLKLKHPEQPIKLQRKVLSLSKMKKNFNISKHNSLRLETKLSIELVKGDY